MEEWISQSLSGILNFQIPDDLIQYILSIETESDLAEYMQTLLDFDNSQHKSFYLELSKRKFPPRGVSKQQKKKISKNKQQDGTSSEVQAAPALITETDVLKSKKKTKFVNLYSQEGKNAQVVLLKGRHHCDCQAAKHDLVNNCLQCGRIICKQEGSGPCLFCGNLVCTPEEQKEINAKTKASAKLIETLLERSRPKGWEAALSHRNKLLEYDRTSERRTHVTDDDSDYFSANSVWLNASEKGKLEKYQQSLHDKKHASRLSKKMTFDFAGRQIIEDKTIEHEVDEELIRQMSGASNGRVLQHDMFIGAPTDRDVAPGINAPMLQFDESVEGQGYASAVKIPSISYTPRVQDPQLQEMSDTGRCLSMHQPWASLLVEGIKIHEGRTWYTSHRGRLWIASTAKAPDQDLVRQLENRYRVLNQGKELKFPSFYPTGCLLGCVTVDNCLPHEEYQKIYPGGESDDSPYVFVCSNPLSLKLRFPIQGQHKIYPLEKSIHQAAAKCLQRMGKLEAEQANAA